MKICKVENCTAKHKGLGFCSKHYKQWKYNNDEDFRKRDIANKAKWLKNPLNYQNHIDQNLVNMKRRYSSNSEYRVSEQQRTKQFRKEKYSLSEEFRRKESAAASQRKELIKQRTPSWANLKLIEEFYKNRPAGHHVDHIVPLRGKIVSGLHVLENLQYLLGEDNLKKSNKLEG